MHIPGHTEQLRTCTGIFGPRNSPYGRSRKLPSLSARAINTLYMSGQPTCCKFEQPVAWWTWTRFWQVVLLSWSSSSLEPATHNPVLIFKLPETSLGNFTHQRWSSAHVDPSAHGQVHSGYQVTLITYKCSGMTWLRLNTTENNRINYIWRRI